MTFSLYVTEVHVFVMCLLDHQSSLGHIPYIYLAFHCNSSRYSHIPNIKSIISKDIKKKSGQLKIWTKNTSPMAITQPKIIWSEHVLLCAILSEFLLLSTLNCTSSYYIYFLEFTYQDDDFFPLCNRGSCICDVSLRPSNNKNSESIAHSNTLSPTGIKNQRT
jgi:Na+/melibiose symporter-like transporter